MAKMLEKMTVSRAYTQKEQSEKKKPEPFNEQTQSQVSVDLNKRLNEFNRKLHSAINND